jgi:hypothetical protein
MTIKQTIQQFEMIDPNLVKIEDLNDLINFALKNIDYIDRFIFEKDNFIINLKVDKVGDVATFYLQLNNDLFGLFELIFKDGKWQYINNDDDDDDDDDYYNDDDITD